MRSKSQEIRQKKKGPARINEVQLLAKYKRACSSRAEAWQATVDLIPSSGVNLIRRRIEDYHDLNAVFILAQRPAMVRVIEGRPR